LKTERQEIEKKQKKQHKQKKQKKMKKQEKEHLVVRLLLCQEKEIWKKVLLKIENCFLFLNVFFIIILQFSHERLVGRHQRSPGFLFIY
jgi:hypothetical protein